MMERKDVRVFKRAKKLGDGVREMQITKEELREYYDYLHGRQAVLGDKETAPDSAPLMVWGVVLLKENGEPWTHGEARS